MKCKTHVESKGPPRGRSRAGGRNWARRLSKAVALFTCGFLLIVVLIAGWGGSGQTAIPQEDPFTDVEVLGVAEMAGKRGGFIDAALGISLSLGANIYTSINGSIVLETLVQFSTGGETSVTNTLMAGADLSGLTFLSADGTEIPGGVIPFVDNTAGPVTFAANGAQITLPAGFQGLVAQTDTGVVAAVNNITSAQFANLVINADPNSIVQQTLQINIDVDGFSALQQTVRFNATVEKFRATMRSASLRALGIN